MIVTIDGPAGSGKSTAARGLAERLGFEFLDTGAMYRAVALTLTRAGIDFADQPNVEAQLERIHIDMLPGRIILNGEDVSKTIRTPEMASASSKVAAFHYVRTFLVDQQRTIACGRDMVCEGRDQGTVVFPSAECKFFLTASTQSRAKRRFAEMRGRGLPVVFKTVLAEQEERDRRDSSRAVSPLRAAHDAIIIDTSEMTVEQTVCRLEEEVRRCRG